MEDESAEGMQLSKFLASCKLGTRREVSAIIKTGKVSINGNIENRPFTVVKSDDVVTIGSKTITLPITYVYFCVNKPKDLTSFESKDQRSMASMVSAKTKAKVSSVDNMGELDLGLGILTDDPILLAKLKEKPLLSHYKVSFENLPTENELTLLEQVKILKIDSESKTIQFTSRLSPAGIREIFENIKMETSSIDRIQMASITKKDLPRGWNRPLTEKEIIFVKHF
jgi:23S rRNA pseudouridine2605 synthase